MPSTLFPSVLSADLLKQLDKYYRAKHYNAASSPLLDYTPNAVVSFAAILYDYIIEPANLYPTINQANYIMQFAQTYKNAVDTISPVLDGFIRDLEVIVNEPAYDTSSEIKDYITYYKTGVDTYTNYNSTNYPTLYDFFCGIQCPLRTFPYVNDSRIVNIKCQADALQSTHNAYLHRFIQLELSELERKLRTPQEEPKDKKAKKVIENETRLELPPEVEAILAPFLVPSTIQPQKEELKEQESQPVEVKPEEVQPQEKPKEVTKPEEYLECFIRNLEPHYTKLATKYAGLHIEDPNNPDVRRMDEFFALMWTSKYALDNKLDPVKDLRTILDLQAQAQPTILDYSKIAPVLSACLQAPLYNLDIKDVMTPDIMTHGVVQGIIKATERYMPQITRRVKHLNYNDLAEALYTEIIMNTYGLATALPLPKLKPLTEEEITAKTLDLLYQEVIPKGDIAPFDLMKPIIRAMNGLNPVADAKERDAQIQTLQGVADEKEIEKQIQEYLGIVYKDDVDEKDQKKKKKKDKNKDKNKDEEDKGVKGRPMVADMITTNTEVLSVVPDPKDLTPVTVETIKDMAYAIVGRACTPYLYEGNLTLHDHTVDKYYRLVPNLSKFNYASYSFKFYNEVSLINRICKKQQLLMTSCEYIDEYYNKNAEYAELNDEDDDPFTETPKRQSKKITGEDLGHIKYRLLPKGDPKARWELLEEWIQWDEELTRRINEIFYDSYHNPEHKQAQIEHGRILTLRYFNHHLCYLPEHKLAAYTYFPQEYSDKIINSPLDPDTGEPVVYHVHHIGGQGHENDNRRENLRITTKRLNDALRYTSQPVVYKGRRYLTLTDYCTITKAGTLGAVSNATKNLKAGEQATVAGRQYTRDTKTKDLIAIDDPNTKVYIYKGVEYGSLAQFTTKHRLKYDTIQTGLKRAGLSGKAVYKQRGYIFTIDGNIITITR